MQTHVDDKWNLAPRAAFTWTVAKTNVRGGWGLFYDWFESGTYEQTVRVDGVTQIDEVVLNPTYPLTATSAGTRLPASRIQTAPSLDQPIVQQASLGFDRNLTPWMGVRADYMWTRGYRMLRSVNVNAPVDGVRPDPLVGNVTETALHRRTRAGPRQRRPQPARAQPPHLRQRDVSVGEHAELRRQPAQPAGRIPTTPTPTGARRRRTSATACS